MLYRTTLVVASIGLLTAAMGRAQSNVVPGLKVRLTEIESPTYWGRRGPSYPGGEVGMTYSYYMCNSGSVVLPWHAPSGGGVMNTDHPMFAFLVVRATADRIVQITNKSTFVKHAHGAANSSGACGSCSSPGNSSRLGVGCTDAYSANTNANRFWLGEPDELNPWTGVWNPVGSYFDRGDPAVSHPASHDGVRSLTSGFFSDPVKNRITVRESDLLQGGSFYYAMHMIVRGEDGDDHLDNVGYRRMSPSWNGSSWRFSDASSGIEMGSVLHAWPGASVTSARNGNDDGHFFVATKITQPQPALYHYEYAVHNLDNARGGASLRIPVCPSTTVTNVGFRDVDGNPLSDWTWSRQADELVFSAPAGNSLDWNHVFNFWFDCDAAPASGSVAIDQAAPGPGSLQVSIDAQIPGGTAANFDLGPGCGSPRPTVTANGLGRIPNPGFGIEIDTTPNVPVILFASRRPDQIDLGAGCAQYLHQATIFTFDVLTTNASGFASAPLPVPSALILDGVKLHWQAAQLVPGGVLYNNFTLSNGLRTRMGCR